MSDTQATPAAPVKNTRAFVGRIVSDKRAKTVTVLVERRTAHELYGKIVAKSRKYHAHDENGDYKMATWSKSPKGARSARPSRGSSPSCLKRPSWFDHGSLV